MRATAMYTKALIPELVGDGLSVFLEYLQRGESRKRI